MSPSKGYWFKGVCKKIITNQEISNANPPVAGTILLWDDLSFGTAKTRNFIEIFLIISIKNHVIGIGIDIESNSK